MRSTHRYRTRLEDREGGETRRCWFDGVEQVEVLLEWVAEDSSAGSKWNCIFQRDLAQSSQYRRLVGKEAGHVRTRSMLANGHWTMFVQDSYPSHL